MVKCQIFVALFSSTIHHSLFRLGMVLQLGVYMSLTESTSTSYLLHVLRFGLFSDITWSSEKFRHTYLSNHALQPLQTWYGASPRGLTCCLQNLHLPLIYFLFYNLVYFLTYHVQAPNFCCTLRGYTVDLTEEFKFVLGRTENILGNGVNAGYLFLLCFQKLSFSGS